VPLAFVLLSLVALVLLPILVRQRTNRIRAELRAAIEPARDATEDAARDLAEQLANVIAYQATEQAQYVEAYRRILEGERDAYRRLDVLTPQLGTAVREKYALLRKAEKAWHAAVDEAELVQRPLPSPIFLMRIFETNPLFDATQRAARDLERAVRIESQERQRAITAAESLNATISTILTMLALIAALTVAWIGRQMRLLAIAAERGREDAARETMRATEARKAAEDAHGRAAFLSEASRELTVSLDVERSLQRVAELAVPLLGDFCLIDLAMGEGELARVASAHRNASKKRFLDQTSGSPLYGSLEDFRAALSADRPTIVADLPQGMRSAIAGADDRLVEVLEPRAALIAPLAARGRTLGVIIFVQAESRRPYTPDDVSLAWEFSRRVALAADNARLYQEAQQALRSQEEILAIVSHDLRSPLTTISMTAALLQEMPPDAEDLTMHMDAIRTSAKRMTRLINDLLDVSRMDAGHRLPIEAAELHVEAVVEELLEIFSPQAEARGVELRVENALDGAAIHADRDRLIQAVSNLLGNALKFTPEGGRVELAVRTEGEAVAFRVSDNGPGIEPENLSHIWDPYWQMSRTARAGAGLGLAIVKGIVEAHGGQISVESTPGAGTTFHFSIPRKPSLSAPASGERHSS
jgi:signal transduction histidine kinase